MPIIRHHRVTRGSYPPPVITERRMRISRTMLFRNCLTAQRWPATPDRKDAALVAVSGIAGVSSLVKTLFEMCKSK